MSVASRLTGALVVLILLLAPLGVHVALVMHRGIVLAGVLTSAQAILVTWIVSSALPHRAWGGTSAPVAARSPDTVMAGAPTLKGLCVASADPVVSQRSHRASRIAAC